MDARPPIVSWMLSSGAVPMWRPDPAPHRTIIAATTRLGGRRGPPYDALNLGRSTSDAAHAVTENRLRVLAELGLDPERLATAGQVHGTRVARVTAPGLAHETDALVTTEPGLALAVSGADCLPIMISAPRAVAAAHSGWRGTADGMPSQVLHALLDAAHVAPEDVLVFLGPGIGACCYRVGSEVATRFPAAAVRS